MATPDAAQQRRYLVKYFCPHSQITFDEAIEAANADAATKIVLTHADLDCWGPDHRHTLDSVREMEPDEEWYPQ